MKKECRPRRRRRVPGEHEVGHRIVGEGAHQHVGQRRDVGGHRRRRTVGPPAAVIHSTDGNPAARSVQGRVLGDTRTPRRAHPPWRRRTRRHRPSGSAEIGSGASAGTTYHDPSSISASSCIRVPTGVAGEQARPDDQPVSESAGSDGQVHRPDRSVGIDQQPPPGRLADVDRRVRRSGGPGRSVRSGPPGRRRTARPAGWPRRATAGGARSTGHPARAVDDHAQCAVVTVVEDQHHPAGEVGVGQAGRGHQQVARPAPRGAGRRRRARTR